MVNNHQRNFSTPDQMNIISNVYRFDGAAIHCPMAGLTRFADEKKTFKAFEKNDQQNYIRGCLESQHHLLRSKTMSFARKNMEIVNEMNDKNTSLSS
jgi:hypothetical protein